MYLLLTRQNKGSAGGGLGFLKSLFLKHGVTMDDLYVAVLETYLENDGKKFKSTAAVNDNVSKIIASIKVDAILITDSKIATALFDLDKSTEVTRGSVYYFKGIPCVLSYDANKTKFAEKSMVGEGTTRKAVSPEELGAYIAYDVTKAVMYGRSAFRHIEHKFKVCHSLTDLYSILPYAAGSQLCAIDIETSVGITCIGFSYLLGKNDNAVVRSFCIPFANSQKSNGTHWNTIEEEIIAWSIVKKLCGDHTEKIFHNGSYDVSYLMKYGIEVKNYYWDTMHIFHSFAPLLKKSLAFVASLFVDNYAYWKDEIKGLEKNKKKTALPKTARGLNMYWEYNLKDTYFTLCSFIGMIEFMQGENYKYVWENYIQEVNMMFGVAMPISYTGMVKDQDMLVKYLIKVNKEIKELEDKARIIFADDEVDLAKDSTKNFVYSGLLRNWDKRPKPSLDEKHCLLIKEEYPFATPWIEVIENSKRLNKITSTFSEYATSPLKHIYTSLVCNPWTGRFSSQKNAHAEKCSGNIQNINKNQKIFFTTKPDHFLVEIDYSQSDNYFVAHACGDPKMIEIVNDTSIDTHVYHAAFFFNVPYEDLVKRIKEGDPVAKFMRTGVKPITHGRHYGRSGQSLVGDKYMGLSGARAIAERKGLDADKMTKAQLASMLSKMMEEYSTILYPKLQEWFDRIGYETAANGNIAQCYGGRYMRFYGQSAYSGAIQRKIASFYGQGGTGGNINIAMRELMNNDSLRDRGIRIVNTVHDSVLFSVPKNEYQAIEDIKDIMERECHYNGYTFTVPVDVNVGISWGDMVEYNKEANPLELYTSLRLSRETIINNLT